MSSIPERSEFTDTTIQDLTIDVDIFDLETEPRIEVVRECHPAAVSNLLAASTTTLRPHAWAGATAVEGAAAQAGNPRNGATETNENPMSPGSIPAQAVVLPAARERRWLPLAVVAFSNPTMKIVLMAAATIAVGVAVGASCAFAAWSLSSNERGPQHEPFASTSAT
jgi:hypothetical protein